MVGPIDNGEGRVYLKGRQLADEQTRKDANATSDVVVTCEDVWSQLQMRAVLMMCDERRLVSHALRRAKRTAGNYAQLFLNDEGTPQQGRFYWAGLAAFAAKQVVDGIEYAETKFDTWVGQARLMSRITYYYLLKGNLWVFFEIVPWMLHWRQYGSEAFFRCVDRRNVQTYDPVAKDQTEALPWAKGENTALKRDLERRMRVHSVNTQDWSITRELPLSDHAGALAEIGQCRATPQLKRGFRMVGEYEASGDRDIKERKALQGATAFLEHEQTLHLQTMVYDHPEFRSAIDNNDLGRYWWHLLGARDPELVFNASGQMTREIERRELQPHGLVTDDVLVRMELEEGKLYETSDRMKYVGKILARYHDLMTEGRERKGQYRPYMLQQMQVISGWKNA